MKLALHHQVQAHLVALTTSQMIELLHLACGRLAPTAPLHETVVELLIEQATRDLQRAERIATDHRTRLASLKHHPQIERARAFVRETEDYIHRTQHRLDALVEMRSGQR